ncbi:hypothetical protein H4S02_002228 [Coemansia sp. RSA 2611]|nr:hypothetical protein H4S02_002228 [Coemansia sp. RSA 2611]
MNFFRKRVKRSTAPDQTGSDKHTDEGRSRRHSYFSMRRRDLTAQTVTPPATVAKLSGGDDDDTGKKSMRRRSIPGIAYLVGRRNSMQLGGSRSGAGIAEPAAAARGGTLERTMSARRARRSSDGGGGSDSGDSDDTLTAKHSDPAPAARRLSAGYALPTICGEPAMPGVASPDCAAADPAPACKPEGKAPEGKSPSRSSFFTSSSCEGKPSGRSPFFIGSSPRPVQRATAEPTPLRLPRSASVTAGSSPDALATMEDSRLLRSDTTVLVSPRLQQRRQALRLSRLRTSTSASTLTSAVRSTLFNLNGSLGQKAGNSLSREAAPSVRFHKKRSAGALSKLSMAPQPTEAEQARMDAWAADDDEFSTSDYDLSGAYFELPLAPASLVSAGTDHTAYGGIGKATGQALPALAPKQATASACTTPGSRLSSTSTVVEECTLSPEQYQRIYASSARKLQWPDRSRGMSSVVHIKSAMTRANECFVVVSGGRHLDACQMPPSVFAPAHDPLGTAIDGPYPARSRSVDCMQQLLRGARLGPPAAEPVRRRSLDSGCLERAAPLDKERLDQAASLYDAGLLGSQAGDLVSLSPIGADSALERTGSVLPQYRPFRRHRHRRVSRRSAGQLQPPFATVAPVTA